jgi:hypothetical protein
MEIMMRVGRESPDRRLNIRRHHAVEFLLPRSTTLSEPEEENHDGSNEKHRGSDEEPADGKPGLAVDCCHWLDTKIFQ